MVGLPVASIRWSYHLLRTRTPFVFHSFRLHASTVAPVRLPHPISSSTPLHTYIDIHHDFCLVSISNLDVPFPYHLFLLHFLISLSLRRLFLLSFQPSKTCIIKKCHSYEPGKPHQTAFVSRSHPTRPLQAKRYRRSFCGIILDPPRREVTALR